jgi:hypothetical protein
MKNLLLLSILLSGFYISKAQNIKTATIQWSSIKTIDVSVGDISDEATTLVSYGTTKLEWKNDNGSVRKTFQVIEVIGDWTNVSSNGSMLYEVSDGSNTGTITFRKDSSGTKVLIVIVNGTSTGPSDPAQATELTIQSSQAL